MKINFGIIGPGNIAERFADACTQVEDVSVYAVASSNVEKAAAFADKFGVEKVCSSYEELWNLTEVDAIYISVINSLHFPIAKKCLEAGKAVLCEKPLCLTYAETKELIETAQKHQVLLMEGIWTLFLPCIQQAKQWVEEGRIGKLKYMSSSFSFYQPVNLDSRLFVKELGGGAALDVGVYCIAFSLFMNNARVKACKSSVYTGTTGVDEMGAALIEFEDNVIANCQFGIQANIDDTAYLYGESGSIKIPNFWGCHLAELYDHTDTLQDSISDSIENGFVHEIKAFSEAYRGKKIEVFLASHQMSLSCAKLLDEICQLGRQIV